MLPLYSARSPFFLLLAAGLLPTASTLAQSPTSADSTTHTHDLNEVTVTGSRLNQRSRDTGRNITIIAGTELSRFPVNSLDDLLRCLPSLEVQSRGSHGAQADITLRGSTFNQVLILLDEQRVNDPLTGHFNSNFPIAPAEIAQIEIIRGAGSALYGPDAVGGIIHIVTKTFAARRPTEAYNVQATGLRGEWKLWHANAGGFAQTSRLRVGGGVLLNKTQGQLREAPSTGRSDLDLKTYSLSAAYDLTPKLNIAVRGALDRRDFDAQYFYTTFASDLSRERTTRDFVQGQLRFQPREGQQTTLQVAHSYSTDYYAFSPPSPTSRPNQHQMRYSNAQLHHTQALGSSLKLGVGGQYDDRRIESNNQGNHQAAHYGLYSLLAYSGLENLTATGSLRFDHDEAYGNVLIPQLNLSYAPVPALVLRGAAGRSIRAANFTERYYNTLAPRAGTTLGLPTLKAERATNYELGADYAAMPWLTFKATAFVRNGRDLIDYVALPYDEVKRQRGLADLPDLPNNRRYTLAQNLRDVRTQGVETEIWAQTPQGPLLRLEAVAGYTYLTNSSPVVSQYLGAFARHQVTGTLTLRAGGYGSLSVSGLYKERDEAKVDAISRRLTADYAVFNARAEGTVLPGRMFVVLQLQNLFDARYADLLGADMPSRWFMAGLRVNFQKADAAR